MTEAWDPEVQGLRVLHLIFPRFLPPSRELKVSQVNPRHWALHFQEVTYFGENCPSSLLQGFCTVNLCSLVVDGLANLVCKNSHGEYFWPYRLYHNPSAQQTVQLVVLSAAMAQKQQETMDNPAGTTPRGAACPIITRLQTLGTCDRDLT